MAVDERVQSLYNALKADGADVGTVEEFNEWFFKPGEEGYNNRKYVYDTFKADGADVGKDYNEFASWLNLAPVDKLQPGTTAPNAVQQQDAAAGSNATGSVGKLGSSALGGAVGAIQAGSAFNGALQAGAIGALQAGGQQNGVATGVVPASKTQQTEPPKQEEGQLSPKSQPRQAELSEKEMEEDLAFMREANKSRGDILEAAPQAQSNNGYSTPKMDKAWKLGYSQSWGKIKGLFDGLDYGKKDVTVDLDDAVKSRYDSMSDQAIESELQKLSKEYKAGQWEGGEEALRARISRLQFNLVAHEYGFKDFKDLLSRRGDAEFEMYKYHPAFEQEWLATYKGGPGENPLLNWGKEIVKKQLIEDTMNGVNRPEGYYHSLPFSNEEFSKRYASWALKRAKALGNMGFADVYNNGIKTWESYIGAGLLESGAEEAMAQGAGYRDVGVAGGKYNSDFDAAAATAWNMAEDEYRRLANAHSDEIWGNYASMGGGREGRIMASSEWAVSNMADNLTSHDLDKMIDNAWNTLGETKRKQIMLATSQNLMKQYPGADPADIVKTAQVMVRQQTIQRVLDYAKQQNAPKNIVDYFARKVLAQNSIIKIQEAMARSRAGTTGDWQAREMAMQEYGKNHRVAGVAGTVVGMGLDPVTYISAGVGKGAATGAVKLIEKAFGAAGRKWLTTTAGKVTVGAISGAANLGAFEGINEALEQLRWGGAPAVDLKTGLIKTTGYDVGKIGKAIFHGSTMGAGTGIVAPLMGNVWSPFMEATSSTAGKMAVKTGELFTGTIAEGTIFSIPDVYDAYTESEDVIKSFSDKKSRNYISDDQERAKAIAKVREKRNETMLDIWNESVATMAGFKAKHIAERLYEVSMSGNGRVGFETRLRYMLDRKPDLALTKDEQAELERGGYTDLKELVNEYVKAEKNRRANSKPVVTGRPRTMELGTREEDMPYNRFVDLMNDGSISEAARAKMYYYITGHALPMSTVMYGQLTENKDRDGNVKGYTVQSIGANGVVTSREFTSRKRAENELQKVNRQIELNTIDIGERYNESIGNSTKELREDIGQKYGVDVEKALKKEPKRRSTGEQMALDEYMRRLFPEKEAREEDAEDVTFSEDTSVTDETTNGFTDETTDEGDAIVVETLSRTGEDGMVHPAVLKGEDESQVNIVSGHVVTLADGTIDVANSDQDIIIVDAKGQRLMISINDIASIGTPIDPNAAMAAAEQANAAPGVPSGTGDTAVSQAANTAAVATGAPGSTQGSATGIEVGGRYNVVDEQNTQHEVEVLRDNGNGTVEVRVDGAEDSMPMAKDQLAAMLGIDVVSTTPQTEQPAATTKPLQEPVEQPAPAAENDMQPAAVDVYRIADDADEKAIGMAGFTRDNIQATADYLNGKLGKREYLERLGFDKNVLAGVNDDKVDTWVEGVANRASEFLTDKPVESGEVSGEYFYESGNTVNPVRYRQEVADMVGRLNQSNAELLSEYEEKMNAAKDDSDADALGDELEEKLQLPPGAAVSWGWDGEKYHPTIDLATGAGNAVSFGYLQSLPTEYKIGDKIGFRYEDRAYNAEVTKTDANGKILEAKDVESGRVVVRDGKVLGNNEIIAESDKENKTTPASQAQGDKVDRTTATIMAARNGDKEAQDKLSSYGIDWEKKPVVRFVSQGEVDSILAGERFNGRFNDGRVDVTNQTTPTTAANSEYRITYKDELDWVLNKRLRMKNKDLGDGWIMDGYSLDDVQTIERRNSDGSYTVVYDANATAPEPMPMREVGKGKNKTTEPDWLAVTPERGHDWLFNEIGLDSADANDIVNANLEAAKKGVEKASKQKPKKTTNPLVLQSERERIKGEQEAAQAVLDYWNQVKAIEADRQAQAAAERKAKDAEVAEQAQAEEQARQAEEVAKQQEQAEREVRKLIAKKKQHEADQVYIHNQKPRLEGQIATAKKRMEQAKKSLELVKDVPENPVITINKVKYPSVDAMADYIKAYNKKVAEAADRVRNSYMDSSEKRDLTMNIGGFDFDVSTVITKDTERTGTTLSYVARRVMTYSCEALGLENVPVKQALLRNAIEDIITNVLTGKDFKERIESSERRITNNESEIKQLNSREGKPFEFDKELAEAEARLADYEEKMKAELEAKEAKYAEMDADIDEASSVDYTDEDDEAVANEDAVPYGDVRRGSLAPQYQKYSVEEMGSGNVPFNGKVLSSGDKSKFKVIDDNAKVFNNWYGSPQKRYQGNVGKKMGNGIYLHKDYATEVIPQDVWDKAKAIADREGFDYNTVYYEPKNPNVVRFDEAPDFDTAREPITGYYMKVDTSTGEAKKSNKRSTQIWHNKWMWVKDDYTGFDVEEAYEWSKRWNQLISNPDGWAYKWDYLLNQANLPIDWTGSALEDKGVVMDEPSVGYGNNISQSFGSAGTSISQTAGTIKRKIQWQPGTVNVDIGGGRFDKATNFLKEKGVENLVFDPFNRNAEHNKTVAERVRDEKVDTVTCTNVLNVIDNQAARANVILQAAKALKDGGTAYFSVYEGDKSGVGRQTQSDSWQNNRRTKDYVPEIEQYFEDVSLKNGVITARNPIPTDQLSVWDFDGQYSGNGIAFERGSSYKNSNGDVIPFESHAEQLSLFGTAQVRRNTPTAPTPQQKRVAEMSDAELLKEMQRDIAEFEKLGRADWGIQTACTDEYDRRHIKEYNAECERVRTMLDENNIGIEEAEQMLLDTIFTWRDGFATPDRTKLLAQFDTLNDYYAEKEDERDNADLYEEERGEDTERADARTTETPPMQEEVALPTQQTEPAKPTKTGFDPSAIKLRKLKSGETCYVERRYQESGGFDFTGSEVVKSDADLAYIFRNLENSAIENTFLVLIKNGKATILHTGMGSYSGSVGHTGAGMLAASQFKPQNVIMVHNHPSGNLVPSMQDLQLQQRVKRMFGEDVVREAIIIDITSGEYSVFDTDNSSGTIKQRPTSAENEIPYKTYSFSKYVFNKGYKPGSTMQITDANKAAAFVSSHRLGERDKLSLLVMNRAKYITGNVFLPWTNLDDVDITKAANKIATYIHQMGGESGIIYGSGTIDRSKLGALSREIENHEVHLDDFINVEGVSAQVQGVLEPEVEYEAVPRNTEQPTEVAEDSVGYGETDDSGISDEELATYDAGRYSFAESITQGLVDLSSKNANDQQLRLNAMREFGGNLAKLRKIMNKQKAYDKATVDDIVRLARMVMGNGFFKNMSAYEVKRLLAAIKKGVGAEDLTPIANNVVDMLVSHQLRESKAALAKLMQIKGRKVDARGIEVQAGLDIDGQRMMSALKDGMSLGENGLSTRINDCENRLDSKDETIKKNAISEYQGLMLAKDYHDNILSGEEEEILLREEKRQEEEKIYDFRRDPVLDNDGNAIMNLDGSVRTVERKTLKPEFKNNVTDENKRKRKDVEAAIEKIEQSIRENRMERVTAYSDFMSDVAGDVRASRERAAAWRDEQLRRVEEIHHNANSDLQDIDPKSQTKEKKFVPIFNPKNDLVRGLFMPLATFEKFMRFFGRRFHNGEGYLFDRYVRGMIDCSDKEWRSKRAAHEELDAKVKEVFNGKAKRWSDLFALERKKKYPTIPVEYWDNGERVRESLSQGEALSLYVWSKQKDAEAGLRRMGISEEDMETLKGQLEPKFVELADWVVSDFLPKRREYYNEVYERMFGAPMAAIENYFPIVRNSRDVEKPTDVTERDMSSANASTITGSFIKRVRTAAALDIHTDFFSHLLKHLDDMEHIAAWAEFNRDLNTLRNYKRFKNRVSNMNSFEFGAGKDLWKAFDNCCAIVAGVYEGHAKSKLDKITLNINKGFTGGAIAFRFNTALKQLLSLPAFWSDASIDQLLLYQTNPVGNFIAWKWAMKNLPGFSKRWQSRQVGDTRLMDTDMDWKLWRNKYMKYINRGGMLANAFVDAVTVASGAKAVYETKKRRYLGLGYSEQQAERKALQDAAISYNGSQQSSESGFVSEMQVDRTFLNNMLTIFRNSPFSYGRKMTTGLRELKKRMRPGYKSLNIEAEATKMEREGIPEDKAKKAARRLYRFGGLHALFDVFNYGYLLSFLWTVLGGSAWYLLFGEDDEKKEEIIKDGTRRLWFSPLEGFTGGNTLSEKGGLLLKYASDEDGAEKALQDFVNWSWFTTPMEGETDNFLRDVRFDEQKALWDVLSLAIQANLGFKPETFTDGVTAIVDYCDGDPQTSKEFLLCFMRVMQVPQSQTDNVYIDELGMTAKDAQKLNAMEMADRYAKYKRRKNDPLSYIVHSDDEDKIFEKYRKRFLDGMKERMMKMDEEQLSWNFDNPNDSERRKTVGQVYSKQNDVSGSAWKKPASNWKPETRRAHLKYQRYQTWEDLAEDTMLDMMIQQAENRGDNDTAKALKDGKKKLNEIKRGKHTKTIDINGLGEGGAEEDKAIMEELRSVRKELIEEYSGY